MRNWKTTVSSAIAALSGFIALNPEYFGGKDALIVRLSIFVSLGGLAAFGIAAEDAQNPISQIKRK